MNRLQTTVAAVRARLLHRDQNQQKMLANVAFFFALMLGLTLIARGTAAATMPMVETTTPVRGEIVQRIKEEGLVRGVKGTPQTIPSGITVDKVLITQGQVVNEGDAVAQLNLKEITQELERERVELQRLQLQVAQLTKKSETEDYSLKQARQELEWAREDLDSIIDKTDDIVDEAKEVYLEARDTLNRARRHLAELEKNPDATEEELEAARQAVEEAEEAFLAAREALYAADENAESQITAADRSVDRAKLAYESALAASERAKEEAQERSASNSVEAKMLALDIKEKKERIAELEALVKSEGIYSVTQTGTVRLLNLMEGQKTPEAPALYVADKSMGYLFEFSIEEKMAKRVKVGTAVTVTQGRAKEEATILTLIPEDNGSMTATVKLEGSDWKEGQFAKAELELSRTSYELCLPICAVHRGSSGDYVLVVEEQSTVLGLQNVLRSVPVNVEEYDNSQIAVTGVLSQQSMVVKFSPKPVGDGSRVRIKP